jgi:coenzyme F420-reducing hydrogenase delta subunit
VVDPSLCVACGICAGACPTSTPFRRVSELIPGIDVPGRTIASIRAAADAEAAKLSGANRIMLFGCMNAGVAEQCRSGHVGVVTLNCTGQLPPSFIDYVLSRRLADGVIIAGCAENSCYNRKGTEWTMARLQGLRDPHLRDRVPRERFRAVWAGRLGLAGLRQEVESLASLVASMGPYAPRRHAESRTAKEQSNA